VQSTNFRWDINLNIARNRNTVVKLVSGLNQLIHKDIDGNAAVIVSTVGRPVGDIMVHPLQTLNGKPIIDQSNSPNASGLYLPDPDSLVIGGNAQPDAWGG